MHTFFPKISTQYNICFSSSQQGPSPKFALASITNSNFPNNVFSPFYKDNLYIFDENGSKPFNLEKFDNDNIINYYMENNL